MARCGRRSSVIFVSVCECVCLLIAFLSPAKTAEPIEMRFRAVLGGPKEPCIIVFNAFYFFSSAYYNENKWWSRGIRFV